MLKMFLIPRICFIKVCNFVNADFDGDELNSLAGQLDELEFMFDGFSPKNLIINRVNSEIKIDISALENVSLAMLSDL